MSRLYAAFAALPLLGACASTPPAPVETPRTLSDVCAAAADPAGCRTRDALAGAEARCTGAILGMPASPARRDRLEACIKAQIQ